MKTKNKIKMSSPSVSVGDLPLTTTSSLLNRKQQSYFIQEAEDPGQRPAGMTSLLNHSAFTLIELLVVVLIIGILAGVALPQYQKAVDKSRYSNLMAITKALADANEAHYLATGKYATDFDELAVDVPATSINGTVANFDWGRCILIGQQEVQCANNTTLSNEYIIHYIHDTMSPGGVFCTVSPATQGSRFDKICSSLGTYYSDSSCMLGACRVYQIYQR